MKAIYLTITALSVSLDSFFCGLSLSSKNYKNKVTLLGISGTVFLLCLAAATLGSTIGNFLESGANILGGAILIIVAGYGFIFENYDDAPLIISEKTSFMQAVILGFSIGLDGALGCFSLAVSGMNGFLVAVYITACHLLLLQLSFISAIKLKKLVERFKIFPPLLLFALGYFKLLNGLI